MTAAGTMRCPASDCKFQVMKAKLDYGIDVILTSPRRTLKLLSESDIDRRYTDFLTAFFQYILKSDSWNDEEPIQKAIENVDLTLGRETFMTIAESLIERGKEKGLKEGKEEGFIEEKQQVLSRLLDKKFGLTGREKESILACKNKEKLDRAIDAFVTASEKSEVLRELD